jgi:aminoglycoside phosphotransferase family enzyme/predicted kinase
MDAHPSPLIEALLKPGAYPHPAAGVSLVETHISWVLLAGEFAYKIKKPVKLPFLDFTTLDQRAFYCREELRLNHRFAPEIYLDVVGIYNTPESPKWQGTMEPFEYAVKMRRFDEAGRLDRLCDRGELAPQHLSELAETVCAFHQAAAPAAADTRFGSAGAILLQALENFDELQQELGSPDLLARLGVLKTWTLAQHAELSALLDARKRSGRVRECHGDLHLANLVLLEGHVRLFDGIEFNDDLRWIDVASDIAFTYMDLLAHQKPGLANWFVNEVLSHSGDYESVRVLRFYAAYRALVRAKVAAIRRDQTHGGDRDVRVDLALAEQLATVPLQRLVITHGLSGCGKTFVTNQLLQSDHAALIVRVRSDVERKRLSGLSSAGRSGSAMGEGIYTPQEHERTYNRLFELSQLLLVAGCSVIVDATFLQRADRNAFRALTQMHGAAFAILAPQADPAQLRDRILARNALGTDASEATLDVLAHQLGSMEPLGADELPRVLPASVPAQGQDGDVV